MYPKRAAVAAVFGVLGQINRFIYTRSYIVIFSPRKPRETETRRSNHDPFTGLYLTRLQNREVVPPGEGSEREQRHRIYWPGLAL